MTYLSCSRVLWSRFRRGFPVRSSSWSLGGRFSGRVISLSSLQLRSTHWQQRKKGVSSHKHAPTVRAWGIAVTTVLLSFPSAAWPQERPRWSWSGRWVCAFAGSSWWWWAQSSACFHSSPPPPAPPTWPFYCRMREKIVGWAEHVQWLLISLQQFIYSWGKIGHIASSAPNLQTCCLYRL